MSKRARKRRLTPRGVGDPSTKPPKSAPTSHDDEAEKFSTWATRFLQRNPPKDFPKEMRDAIEAGRVWMPPGIGEFMAYRAGKVLGVQEIAELLRLGVGQLNCSDDRILTAELVGLISSTVERLNWLAEAGKLGDAARRYEMWPINYAPDASKGASKWEKARNRYRKLGCGNDGVIHRIPGQVSYENRLTELVEIAVRAALLARRRAPRPIRGRRLCLWVDGRVKHLKLTGVRQDRQGRTKLTAVYYLCEDGELIIWPEWAQRCRTLPYKLTSGNWREFLPVIRQLVRICLIQDEQLMRKYLGKNAWDAATFNKVLSKDLKRAMRSLACR